jgi:hypothetical protein
MDPGERCRATGGEAQPLVTELPAAETTQLQALAARGAVAVSYTGCELHAVPQCALGGRYLWRRTSPATDRYEFHDRDQLRAQLPLGALSLEAALEQRGGLLLETTVAGHAELADFDPRTFPRDSQCNGATHLVRSIAVGASALRATASSQRNASIGPAGGGTERGESLLRQAGVAADCAAATDAAPAPNCNAPLQLFLEPIPRAWRGAGASAPIVVQFVSTDPGTRWDILADDKVLCHTPCTQSIDPSRPLTLRTSAGFMQGDENVTVPDLLQVPNAERVTVRAHPKSFGKFVGGITLTTFGGIATVTGVTLLSVGYGVESRGMAEAGLYTFVASPALLIPGILLIVAGTAGAEITGEVPSTAPPR